jgi:hypothetical protein
VAYILVLSDINKSRDAVKQFFELFAVSIFMGLAASARSLLEHSPSAVLFELRLSGKRCAPHRLDEAEKSKSWLSLRYVWQFIARLIVLLESGREASRGIEFRWRSPDQYHMRLPVVLNLPCRQNLKRLRCADEGEKR